MTLPTIRALAEREVRVADIVLAEDLNPNVEASYRERRALAKAVMMMLPYVQHSPLCDTILCHSDCDCGLDAALKEIE